MYDVNQRKEYKQWKPKKVRLFNLLKQTLNFRRNSRDK